MNITIDHEEAVQTVGSTVDDGKYLIGEDGVTTNFEKSMLENHDINPTTEHFDVASMVDLHSFIGQSAKVSVYL